MIYTGFADEAGSNIDLQIKATKEMGWSCIDVRLIDGVNVTDITDEQFEEVYKALCDNGITVPCIGSAIATASRNPFNPEDVQYCFDALARIIPRMKKLGTKYIRGMAFAHQEDLPIEEQEKVIYPLMEKIVKICEENDIVYLCENCGGYSVYSYDILVKLAEHLQSENFKILFDTGNPIAYLNHAGEEPYKFQNSRDAYLAMKEYIGYIHVKDEIVDENGKVISRNFPGEGNCDVEKILKDVIDSGYDGYMSIEPHMHNGYDGYIEYGRRTEAMVNKYIK